MFDSQEELKDQKEDEKRKRREEKARLARQAAIQELQKKREEKRHENQRKAEEELVQFSCFACLGKQKPLDFYMLLSYFFQERHVRFDIIREGQRHNRRCGGLMVSTLVPGASSPGSSQAGRVPCVVFLGKIGV